MKRSLTLLAALAFTGLAFAQSAELSGEVTTMWGITAPWTENGGDFSTGTTDFTSTVEAYAGNGTVHADYTLSYDAVTESYGFCLGEAYADYSAAFWGIRIGQQKIVWGKADGVYITDSVFPKDSTSLFTDDASLPVTAARLSVTGSFFTADALWIPFFKGTELPLEESNPLRSALIPTSVSISGVGTIPVNIGSLEAPEAEIKNSEYGLKLSGYFPVCDLSLYGFYGWDKTPLMNYSLHISNPPVPDAVNVSGSYERLAMIGADAAFPIGETVLRLEGAYFPNRKLQASSSSILSGGSTGIAQQEIMALAGIDWMPSGWTITAQYYGDVILDKSKDLEQEDSYTHGATLSVSRTLLQETLELSVSGLMGFNDFDSAIEASAAYSITDQLKLSGGAYVFLPGPENDGTYGAFKDLSTLYIKAAYCF